MDSWEKWAMLDGGQEKGKYEEAEPLLKRALSIREQVIEPEHPYTRIVRASYRALLQWRDG